MKAQDDRAGALINIVHFVSGYGYKSGLEWKDLNRHSYSLNRTTTERQGRGS